MDGNRYASAPLPAQSFRPELLGLDQAGQERAKCLSLIQSERLEPCLICHEVDCIRALDHLPAGANWTRCAHRDG